MFSVIFDMDGVLVDSEPVICEASIRGLKEYGVNAVPEDFVPFVGTGEDRFIGGVAEKYGLLYKVEMKHRVYEIYLDIVRDKIKVFPGIHELLRTLRRFGIKMAVGSSADRIKVNANLDAAGISLDLFSAIVSGENVKNKKPCTGSIYPGRQKPMSVEPASCIVLEDSLNGIRSSKSTGMKCIAITSSFSREQLLNEQPDFICDDIPEVQKTFEKLAAEMTSV